MQVHVMTLGLPRFELYEEGSQVRRSSKSVTSMIVEGYARRRYKADFVKYLVFAQAECDETLVHLDFLCETESLKNQRLGLQLKTGYNSLSRQLNKFIQWVEHNWNTPTKLATGNR
jgi:four helix bundle protein